MSPTKATSTTEDLLNKFLASLTPAEGRVGPGYIFIEQIPVNCFTEQKTAGGLVMVSDTASGKGERQESQYGIVRQCSEVYMEHSGRVVEPECFVYKACDFPLAVGQIVAVRNTVPWQAYGSQRCVYIKPVDLLHVWAPGTKPKFM